MSTNKNFRISIICLACGILFTLRGAAQVEFVVHDNTWKYKLKVEGITDEQDAKAPMAIMRQAFGKLPTFNDILDEFIVECRKDKSELALQTSLLENGFELISWSKELNPLEPVREDDE